MSVFFSVLVVLCGVSAIVLFVIFLIRAIMKKSKKWIGISALFCVVGVIVFSVVSSQVWLNSLTPQERDAYYADQQLKMEQREQENSQKEKANQPTFEQNSTEKKEAERAAIQEAGDEHIQAKEEAKEPADEHISEQTEAEKFAEDNSVPVAFAESLEMVLCEMELTDKSRVGIFHYKLSDVYDFEQTNDWAEGERYKMWMGMEHIWFAYRKGNEVVGIRDGNGNIFYQAE